MKFRNEIRKNAAAFLKCWKAAYDEKSQASSCLLVAYTDKVNE
jgi:hypothetical protein